MKRRSPSRSSTSRDDRMALPAYSINQAAPAESNEVSDSFPLIPVALLESLRAPMAIRLPSPEMETDAPNLPTPRPGWKRPVPLPRASGAPLTDAVNPNPSV